jgi:hypothetical protein
MWAAARARRDGAARVSGGQAGEAVVVELEGLWVAAMNRH